MLGSYQIYRASPEAFFESLDKKLADLEAKISGLSKQFEDLATLSETILTKPPAVQSHSEAPRTWVYYAALPNLYFDDVFAAEQLGSLTKRWVGRSGQIAARLHLPRNCQYDFSFRPVDFVNPGTAASLSVSVNGEKYPWLEVKDGVYRTIILESDEAEPIEFTVAVDKTQLVETKDVSFSFSYILIERRG